MAAAMALFILVLITASWVLVSSRAGPSTQPRTEFRTHRRIRRHIIDSHTLEQLDSTSARAHPQDKHHRPRITLIFEDLPHGRDSKSSTNMTLDLSLNTDLIPESYFEKHHSQGRSVTTKYSSYKEIELCHYHGHVRGRPHSWVAMSTCDNEIQGVIFDGHEFHHVEPGSDAVHFLYRQKDHTSEPIASNDTQRIKRSVSNTKGGLMNQDEERPSPYNPQEGGLGLDIESVLGPWNANKQSRYVELVLVVDKREFQDHNEDLQKVQRICKDIANVMNGLYSPLNIYIALVGVIVWTEYDEIKLSTNGDQTLTNFLHYRKERLVKEHPNDNAQLLTGITFDGGVVGKALKGPMCTYEFSGGVNMWHSDVIGLVATTVAHEMGHNFGMEHDREYCVCPDDRCIMAPASSTLKPSFWSSCSLEYLALAFEQGMDYCLRNRPLKLFEAPVCGNGFVEQGEECDCGLKNHCDNPCCNPESCTLYANATCATGECCDFHTCQPKAPGSLCRMSDHACDLPEFCTGETEFCPDDVYKVDGTACKVGHAFCYQGSCRTHSDQCKLLWGPSGKKADNQCFEQNLKGSRHGNCGYNRINESYIQCSQDDVRCGMLHCSHLNERLEFGMESAAILSHSFINSGGRIIPCRTALVDLGLNDVDPGMVPEGSKCGDGKLCVNHRCLPVESLVIGPQSCPRDCSGNGICNSKGHCHCNVGYTPPFCDEMGTGGSVDSGPASLPDQGPSFKILLFAFLALIPLLCFCCIAMLIKSKRLPKRPGEWRSYLAQKGGSASGREEESPTKKYHSKVDISAPLESSGLVSVTPSPSHALLPHVDTATSAIGSSPNDPVDSSDSGVSVKYKRQGSSKSASGNFFSRLGRKPSTGNGPGEGEKVSFMQSLARSITFPSSLKSREGSAKYEIRVEHQQPNSEQSSPIDGPQAEKEVDVEKAKEDPPETEATLTSPERKPTGKPPPPPRPAIVTPISNPKLAFPHSSTFTSGLTSRRSPFLTSSSSYPLASSSLSGATASTTVAPTRTSFSYQTPLVSKASSGITPPPLNPPLATKNPVVIPERTLPSPFEKKYTAVVATSIGTSSVGTATTLITTSRPLQSPFFKKISSSTTSPSSSSLTTVTSPSQSVPVAGHKVGSGRGSLTKTSTLPISLSAAMHGTSESGVSKSSTLPLGLHPAGARPEIGKPVFQTATSSAQSLISRAPSTGISQSSILSKAERRDQRSSKGVVFCDPITLPSPTNPNNPPIIHQPTMTGGASTVTSMSSSRPSPSLFAAASPKTQMSVITPTWTTEPKPLTSDAVICHIDEPNESEGLAQNPAPIASPDRESATPSPSGAPSVPTGGVPKPKARTSFGGAKAIPPDNASGSNARSNLRGLEISGPILQSPMDIKTKLVPVRATDGTSLQPQSPVRTLSPTTSKRIAPPPPIQPRGHFKPSTNAPQGQVSGGRNSGDPAKKHNPLAVSRSPSSASSKRPASIATSRPVRPSAPPPMPPPGRVPASPIPAKTGLSLQPLYDEPPREEVSKSDPIYEKIHGESPEKEMGAKANLASKGASKKTRPPAISLQQQSVTSPQDSEYGTPSSSPLFGKRSPDSVSMASSEGDLMKEILKEIVTKDDEIYSTLTRKKKKNSTGRTTQSPQT